MRAPAGLACDSWIGPPSGCPRMSNGSARSTLYGSPIEAIVAATVGGRVCGIGSDGLVAHRFSQADEREVPRPDWRTVGANFIGFGVVRAVRDIPVVGESDRPSFAGARMVESRDGTIDAGLNDVPVGQDELRPRRESLCL